MKFTVFYPVLACGALFCLASCSTKADAELTHELQDKTDQLKVEADLLAAQAAAVQQKIKEAGSEDMTGPGIVVTLENTEKEVIAEKQRLEKLKLDLQTAIEGLTREQAAFAKKYLKS